MSTRLPSGSQIAPVFPVDRITSLDVLRGVAILGILLMNLQSFAQPVYDSPLAYGDLHGANLGAWVFSRTFAHLKFLSIFSMLFGAGVCLFTSGIEASGKSSVSLHYRRMVVLLAFGLLHGYLLWSGDILVHYALCGMLLYPFRKLSVKHLLLIGGIFFAVPLLAGLVYFRTSSPAERQEIESELHPTPSMITEDLASYRGSWRTQETPRAVQTFEFETTVFGWEYFWREFGLMLAGMALFKLGVFSAKLSGIVYARMIAVAILVGVPLALFSIYDNYRIAWQSQRVFYRGEFLDYFSSLLIAFGWVGAVMLLCKSARAVPLKRALQAVGRAAFSNYILQTLICSMLFYGEGFTLYGRVSRLGQLLLTLLIWAMLVALSNLWFRHFRIGPLEFIWRALTYGKLPAPRSPTALPRLFVILHE
jgi:uncharacterized protein